MKKAGKIPDWGNELEAGLAGVRSLVILGVGNEMMADDGAGALIAKQLRKCKIQPLDRVRGKNSKLQITVIEAGTTPENFTGVVRKARPDSVLIIDAADMGRKVGEVALLEPEAMGSMMHSTHTMPLSFLAGYIERTSGARALALGIQAGRIGLDEGMSKEVARSVKDIVKTLGEILYDSGA